MLNWKDNTERINATYKREKSFVCVEYPGIIQNTQKAISTLGGQEKINKIYTDPTKRLPLCWRPEDVYCKAAYADRFNTNNLLMRVRRRRRKTEGAKYEYSVEILGIVPVSYKFQAMSDFQYLPMQKKENDQYESIYDKVVLNKLTSHKEYFSRDVPLFMPPLSFSRVDTPCDFLYRSDIEHRVGYVNPDNQRAPHLIGTVRQKRTIYTIFVNFGESVPEKPIEAAVKRLHSKYVNPVWEKDVKKLFEEKPLYLKVEIQQRTGYSSDKLKMCLPALCFYWLDGPWRAQWNKFGYDPTKCIKAKIYQTLDFRIRAVKPGQKTIKPKRSLHEVNRWNQQARNKPLVAKISLAALGQGNDDSEEAETSNSDQEVYYKFFPDKLPPHRLMYYQLCQIELDEVKKLIHENDGNETTCTEKDGWCIKDMTDQCRDIMYKYTERLLSTDDTVQQSFAKRLKHKRLSKKIEESDDDDEDDDTYNTTGVEMEIDEG